MCGQCFDSTSGLSRRGFLQVSGMAAGMTLAAGTASAATCAGGDSTGCGACQSCSATVRGAFVYPPTTTLEEAGYYSWPGSGFDAEGRQQAYQARLGELASTLGMTLGVDDHAIDTEADAAAFIASVKQAPPDGLLLVLFKKGHLARITQIVEEAKVPAVVVAPLGVLLVDHINTLREQPGVHLINASEAFDAIAGGLRMLRTRAFLRNAVIMNIDGSEPSEQQVPFLGTTVRTIPHERFYATFAATATTAEIEKLAREYRRQARGIVEPGNDDILEAARCYFALKQLVNEEKADALMMNCLPGLQRPHKHVPPCMAFMSLRDEGFPAGCQSDLNATLSLMLVQSLFGLPGFQQNASMDTVNNLYFGAHCTCPSKMNGPDKPALKYILRDHAEAGWGCVPRVLFPKGQDVTIAQYVSGDAPQMYVYSGSVVDCPECPPTGGCRTNVTIAINEVEDACDVKGMHQAVFFGNRAGELRAFCQLCGISAVA